MSLNLPGYLQSEIVKFEISKDEVFDIVNRYIDIAPLIAITGRLKEVLDEIELGYF